MMNKIFVRIVATILLPSLLLDPIAASYTFPPLRSPTTHVENAFQEEALMLAVAAGALHSFHPDSAVAVFHHARHLGSGAAHALYSLSSLIAALGPAVLGLDAVK